VGSLDFYNKLEKLVEKYWDKYDDKEKSKIFYAYANRKVLSGKLLNKTILPWV
jgi:hypothetical protein